MAVAGRFNQTNCASQGNIPRTAHTPLVEDTRAQHDGQAVRRTARGTDCVVCSTTGNTDAFLDLLSGFRRPNQVVVGVVEQHLLAVL